MPLYKEIWFFVCLIFFFFFWGNEGKNKLPLLNNVERIPGYPCSLAITQVNITQIFLLIYIVVVESFREIDPAEVPVPTRNPFVRACFSLFCKYFWLVNTIGHKCGETLLSQLWIGKCCTKCLICLLSYSKARHIPLPWKAKKARLPCVCWIWAFGCCCLRCGEERVFKWGSA